MMILVAINNSHNKLEEANPNNILTTSPNKILDFSPQWVHQAALALIWIKDPNATKVMGKTSVSFDLAVSKCSRSNNSQDRVNELHQKVGIQTNNFAHHNLEVVHHRKISLSREFLNTKTSNKENQDYSQEASLHSHNNEISLSENLSLDKLINK